MIDIFPPALVFIIGAVLIPFLKGKLKSVYMLILPIIAFLVLRGIPEGNYVIGQIIDKDLFLRIDKLSLVFGYVFILITFIGIIYALHITESGEHTAAFVYAGSALGIVFAGDLITMFIFWELLTIAALFILWSNKTKAAQGAAQRYILVHLFGGVCLLAGIILRVYETGSTEFGFIGVSGLSSYLILLGVAVNVAIPPFHSWLPDTYPQASVTGTVFLSVFTTKAAVYVLARAFPGAEILIIAGVVMAVYPIFFAVLENDLRRVLSYSLINQVGFMVVGIGIGIPLAVNGAVAHAFADILFKSLLFMAIGAVLYRTGTAKATELGGLYKSMPITLIYTLIGAASISAFPLFSAFATKSMIISAAGNEGMTVIYFLLLFAAAGVFHHAGIKIPFFTFFAHDSGKRPKEAPLNMLIAMGIAAVLSIFIGVYPEALYRILPNTVDYVPYTADHVISQLLLLFGASSAFTILMLTGIYPPEKRSINIDTDWFYRKAAPVVVSLIGIPIGKIYGGLSRVVFETLPGFLTWFTKNPIGALKIGTDTLMLSISGGNKEAQNRLEKEKAAYPGTAKQWSISTTLAIALIIFAAYLILFFF
jgi:multicomponent Na+:H+ antiporter subunit D